VAGSFGHDNESSGSIKGKELLDFVSDCQLVKQDSFCGLILSYPLSLAVNCMQHSSNDLEDEAAVHIRQLVSALTSLT
jgi:hypothetical protein